MVDALASGASGGNPVEVQVLFSAPDISKARFTRAFFVQLSPQLFISTPSTDRQDYQY